MHVDSETYVWINKVENEWLKTESRVRKGALCLHGYLILYMDRLMKELMEGVGEKGLRVIEKEEREKYLAYCIAGWIKLLVWSVDKSKVILVGKESLQCRIMLDGDQLENISDFKYLYYMSDDKERYNAMKCSRKVGCHRKIADSIKSLMSAKRLSWNWIELKLKICYVSS